MSTESLTAPPTAPAATSSPATSTGTTYSVVGLVLSIVSLPTGLSLFAIAGIVLGFVGRSKEPSARLTANWAIVIGFVALFGGLVFAIAGFAFLAPFVLTGLAFDGFWLDGPWFG